MAKYTATVRGELDDFLYYLDNTILSGSVSASYEDGCDYTSGGVHIVSRVYERYSYIGGNRVSLHLLLTQAAGGDVQFCAITSGGSQAMFFKVNTFGEESFLDKVIKAVEAYPQRQQG